MTKKKAKYTCPEDEKPQYETNWMDIILDERQQNEVHFNKVYADKFNHGTDGHNPRILIAILAKAIDLLVSAEEYSTLSINTVLNILANCSCPEGLDFSLGCSCPNCREGAKLEYGSIDL